MPMAQILRSYSSRGNSPGSIAIIRPSSTCAVMPQRGLAWQLGSQTVLNHFVSGIEVLPDRNALQPASDTGHGDEATYFNGFLPSGTDTSNALSVIATIE